MKPSETALILNFALNLNSLQMICANEIMNRRQKRSNLIETAIKQESSKSDILSYAITWRFSICTNITPMKQSHLATAII